MNRREFHQLCASSFGFLVDHGFIKEDLGPEDAYVIFEKDDILIEIKWEDWGYFIFACIIRKELEQDSGWISVNSLIKITSPNMYRTDARGPAELFGHEALVRYFAEGLSRGLKMLLQDTEAIWSQCRIADQQVAERELFLADETDGDEPTG